LQKAYQLMKQTLETQGMGNFVPNFESYKSDKEQEYSLAIKSRDKSFHYLPYNFGSSGASNFELETLKNALKNADFKKSGLEIYYNGERGLSEFVIDCFAKIGKYLKPIGKYTTDFLIIKRDQNNQIHQASLVETKGKVFADDKSFLAKKHYVENEFLELNKAKFGYQKFDFLYLDDPKTNISQLTTKINQFFNNKCQ